MIDNYFPIYYKETYFLVAINHFKVYELLLGLCQGFMVFEFALKGHGLFEISSSSL
jgi:hypothetical protein